MKLLFEKLTFGVHAFLFYMLPNLIISQSNAATAPIEVKVVVVTMFEKGEPKGDAAGELQRWVERENVKETFDFPIGEFPLFLTKDNVLLTCTGGGIPNATASIMALGLDNRFDLSSAYWLIVGIAGGDPEDISIGSAAWASVVVDGDLAYEIDAREIPENWPYGYLPLGASKPAESPDDIYTGWTLDTIKFDLNEGLSKWAFEKTKDAPLTVGKETEDFQKLFKNYPNAQKAPFVTMGETLSSSTYWHGKLLNKWANDWVKLYSDDSKNFMTSNMEDSGTLTALKRLERAGLVKTDRVMVLRTVSNYTMPPEDKSASWSTTAPYPEQGVPAFETAYTVGHIVVDEIVAQWNEMKLKVPRAE
ncbi:purine nucleoside permease [Zobellia sp.]|nr:purine nucleoside permease [Zobellia sp.]